MIRQLLYLFTILKFSTYHIICNFFFQYVIFIIYKFYKKYFKIINMMKSLYVILFFIELLDNLRPVSPKSSHMERVKTPLGITNTVIEEEEQPFKERFLKITVRHITDGQVKFIS